MENYIEKVIGAIVALIAGGFVWCIRTINSNKEEIRLLQAELKSQREQFEEAVKGQEKKRDELRSEMAEIKADIKELRKDLHNFLLTLKIN